MSGESSEENPLLLSWKNYEETVKNAFKRYLSSKWYCNVLLSAEGRSIPCHKELLSASSDWFEEVLSSLDTSLHPIIVLKDVKFSELEYLVNFMYCGEVAVPSHQVQDLINVAQILKIKGVYEGQTQSGPSSECTDSVDHRLVQPPQQTKDEQLNLHSRAGEPDSELSFKIARKSSPTKAASDRAEECGWGGQDPPPSQAKVKKRRVYENSAPVYDNRQIYAADLLQTQLDYSGEELVMNEDNEGYEITDGISPVSGVEDCGSFKKIWSNTYLCYNLGKEILCLLCFCRFTQFKKFNLERHMRKKHPDYYQLDCRVKKRVLDVLVGRYEDMVTPAVLASIPTQGNEHMVTDFLQMDSIEWSSILGEEGVCRREEDEHLLDSGERQDQPLQENPANLPSEEMDHSLI